MPDSRTGDILIFPFPAQGHMLPLLDLAHHLSLRSLSITILITPKNLPILTPLLSTHPSIQTLILPFPTHPSIPPGVENVKDLSFSGFGSMMFTLGKLYDPLLHWFNSNPSPPPTAVVYDFFFLRWTQQLCRQVGVRCYAFSPCGALSLSVFSSLWGDMPRLVDDDGNRKEMISFSNVPKSPCFHWWQVSFVYRKFCENREDPIWKFMGKNFSMNFSSDGLILNTFGDIEEIYLDHLKEVYGHERVWGIGPLLPPSNEMEGQRGGPNSVSDDEVCKWLDKHENRSVVYVCFGSQIVLTNEQMETLTNALAKSGVKFLLVIKDDYMDRKDMYVEGDKYGLIQSELFKERVAEKGLLINGWAPQVSILKHPAVGAFLFHGGWNAILENILLGGVPMLVWPMIDDHHANAIVIVDELKIGVRACSINGIAGAMPDSDELARLLYKAIFELDEEKTKCMELHRATLTAIKEGGGSFKGLNSFVSNLS